MYIEVSLLQIVECFPNTLPKDLPETLGKMKWTKKAAEVSSWTDWWEMHEKVKNDFWFDWIYNFVYAFRF